MRRGRSTAGRSFRSRSASGRSSDATIQSIAPAAKPSPTGSSCSKASTKRKAGTAISGWGRLEKTLHAAAAPDGNPARDQHQADGQPSGML